MSKMMIIGVKGEEGLWLVDFDAGTVTAMAGKREDYVTSAAGPAPTDNEALDFAEYFETKDEAFSGHVWRTPAVDLAVGFEPKEAAFSGHVYRTPAVDLAVGFEPKEAAFSGHVYRTPAVDVPATKVN
ncbi:hypothetical protein [Rhizobium leguminosarum]|uniref:Uncharacterized protein n=1 Tax=Rhizobium leguminosarum TaxID=384 RepID=A0A7K3VLF0_RHILE|nr:hypothetical protein [Rhizobium leguminosarum]NEK17694.1 hypothetical protein [Rhizobium leguminosarum]